MDLRIFVCMRPEIKLLPALAGLVLSLALGAQEAAWQQSINQYIESQIANGPLKGAAVGMCAMEDGRIIAAYNASTRMVPASNLKLVTTGTALHAFGPEYRFKTTIAYSGSISEDGTLHGDICIIGGGDPTIGAKDSTAYKADALFWKWKSLLADAGIKRIDGNIIGDGSAYEGGLEHIGWEHGDVWTYYGTGTSALSFYENTIDLEVSAGGATGEKVNLVQSYPETPWLQIENQAVTGPSGTGNSLLLNTSYLSTKAILTGTYAIDRKPKKEQAANKFGALTCAHEFYKNLKATGWEVSGTYTDKLCGDVTVIGQTLSPALSQICRRTNYESDNFYAEALMRAMGEAASGVAVYDSCLVAVREVLDDIVPGAESGIVQKDGSGLSRANSVSPEWMVTYLDAMKGNQAFVESIPHPGEGTLYNLKNLQPRQLRIKSGSMGGVLCYSGYVLQEDGTPLRSFCIMTNNLDCKLSKARPVLESIMLLLSRRD